MAKVPVLTDQPIVICFFKFNVWTLYKYHLQINTEYLLLVESAVQELRTFTACPGVVDWFWEST